MTIPKRALAEGGFLTSKSLMGCKSGVGWLPASSFPFLSPDLVVRYFRIQNQGFPDGWPFAEGLGFLRCVHAGMWDDNESTDCRVRLRPEGADGRRNG